MKIVQITTDSREHFREYDRPQPYFGTAPAGLITGFSEIPDIEVHVISCSHHTAPAPKKIGPNIWFHQPVLGNWAWGKSLFLGCAMAVRKIIREIDPDIVHGQGTERDCAMAAVLSGYPNLLTIHGNMRMLAKRPENKNNPYYRLSAWLEGFCLGKTDGVIAISSYTQDLVKNLCQSQWLLPNAVDVTCFDIVPVPPATPRFLVVGSIVEWKNPVGLIRECEALLRQRRCTIAFAGQGNRASTYVQTFEQLAAEIPGVELLGFLDRNELARELGRSTAVVLPTFEDNCPMVVLEGMAAGLPVAASQVGGVPDLIRNNYDGLMFDPSRPGEIASTLGCLIESPELCATLGINARNSARQRFHPKVVAEEHLRIYRELLETRGNASRRNVS